MKRKYLMGLSEIVNIIIDENLSKNWELDRDDKKVIVYYNNFEISFMYDNGSLYSILYTSLNIDKEQKQTIKKLLSKDKHLMVYLYDNDLYIQCKYKRFTKDVLLEQVGIYEDIQYYIENFNTKKNIFIYHGIKNEIEENNYQL